MSNCEIIVLNNVGGGQSVYVASLPKVGESVKGHSWRYNVDAGKGPNSAICMARLGAGVAFIGKLAPTRPEAGQKSGCRSLAWIPPGCCAPSRHGRVRGYGSWDRTGSTSVSAVRAAAGHLRSRRSFENWT